MGLARQAGRHREGRGLLLPRLQLAPQVAQELVAEAGADLARVDEPSLPVVDADQQGPQPDPCPLGVGEPADDDLLLEVALDLEPAPGAAGGVGQIAALGDDPLHPHATRVGEDCLALADDVVAVAE